MATISSSKRRLRLPTSSQLRNALAYLVVLALGLLLLNLFSRRTTRELMFRAKYTSAQDKMQVVASAFSGVDPLTAETVDQVIAVLGDLNVTRLIVTNAEGIALYDSSETQNAAGRRILLPAVIEALEGNDVFHSAYQDAALLSYAAVPILDQESLSGCVYMMEYDAEQGQVIANLERTLVQGSLLLLGMVLLCSFFFAMTGSRRMRKILTSMRLVREGEYSHKIQMRGSDELATLATEFNKLTDRLQESEAQQRQFVSDASHELKTPLASIKLLSDSILQNEMDADTMREFVADIGNEADRLTRMTQKLLTLNRAESAEVEHEIVDLSVTLSSVFRMLVPLADSQQIKLTANVDRSCTILAFEDDAYQIMFNLVENGIKYNRPGGKVHVCVTHTEEDVAFSVQDTGVGIPADAVEHIFERFYRVDKARSRQAGGSGLGLSIVHDLVERNFGTIRVDSEPGSGTCFTVTFPYFGAGGVDDAD